MEDHLRRLITLAQAQDSLLGAFELDCVCQEFKQSGPSDNPWVPFPQPTRVHILVDEREAGAPHRRFRAEYRPQVVQWSSGAVAGRPVKTGFVVTNQIVIGDGHQTTSYAEERAWRPTVYRHPTGIYLTGEQFLLCRFGRRAIAERIGPAESEPVMLARAILEPERLGARGIVEQRTAAWDRMDNGCRALRLEQAFSRGARHVYWLDPERGYAPLRFAESDAGGEPETLFEVEELSQVAPDFWFPTRVSSNGLNPSPRQSSPVQVKPAKLPPNLPPVVNAGQSIHWVTSKTALLPKELSIRCRYEFSNVRLGIEIPAGAFEFVPPAG